MDSVEDLVDLAKVLYSLTSSPSVMVCYTDPHIL